MIYIMFDSNCHVYNVLPSFPEGKQLNSSQILAELTQNLWGFYVPNLPLEISLFLIRSQNKIWKNDVRKLVFAACI